MLLNRMRKDIANTLIHIWRMERSSSPALPPTLLVINFLCLVLCPIFHQSCPLGSSWTLWDWEGRGQKAMTQRLEEGGQLTRFSQHFVWVLLPTVRVLLLTILVPFVWGGQTVSTGNYMVLDIFSVTKRSRSDESHSLNEWLSGRSRWLYWCDPGEWGYL